MFPDLNNPEVQKQLNQVAMRPASREAERLLALVKATRNQEYPAVVDLLMWAVEAAPELGLDDRAGEALQQDLMQALLANKPRAAFNLLMGEQEEAPAELVQASTPKEAAAAVLNLANQALVG